MSDLATLSTDVFAPHLGTGFTLEAEDGVTVSVKLVRCPEHPHATKRGSPRTAFSLFLECPATEAPPFSDGSFTLVHPELGRIGPMRVGRVLSIDDPSQAVFQIVFN